MDQAKRPMGLQGGHDRGKARLWGELLYHGRSNPRGWLMGKGFHANKLMASCSGTKVLNCGLFNESTAHIVYGKNDVAGPQTNITSGGCWYDGTNSSHPSGPKLAGKEAYSYGYSPTLSEIQLDGNMRFDLAELDTKVGPFTVYPFPGFPFYYRTIQGWRFKNSMCVLPLVRKYSHTIPKKKGFTDVYWTDSYPQDPDQPDLGNDWLGNIYNDGDFPTASMMMSHGVTEPFLGESFYEDTTSSIDKTKSDYQVNFAPFCSPISIYSAAGALTGLADGLAFQLFVAKGAIKDIYRPVKNPDNINQYLPTTLDYWSIELWAYLSIIPQNNSGLKSPRIHTDRWWYYTKEGFLVGSKSPCEPYFFLKMPMQQSRVVQFGLLDNGNNPDHLASKSYTMPWSMGQVYLTA